MRVEYGGGLLRRLRLTHAQPDASATTTYIAAASKTTRPIWGLSRLSLWACIYTESDRSIDATDDRKMTPAIEKRQIKRHTAVERGRNSNRVTGGLRLRAWLSMRGMLTHHSVYWGGR
jgi:hypothetical protein